MKVYGAFCLILPFAHGVEFASAKVYNPCALKLNGGYGYGRVEAITLSASCISRTSMDLWCNLTHPHNQRADDVIWNCEGSELCLRNGPKHIRPPDAGCINMFSPAGIKGAADQDNHACTSGMRVGDRPLYLLSSITPDDPILVTSFARCSVVQSGTQNMIYNRHPCPKTSSVIKLAAKTTYQACIDTAVSLAKKSVGFHWRLDTPGSLGRHVLEGDGLEDSNQKPLWEMVTLVGNSTANDFFKIMIGDREL